VLVGAVLARLVSLSGWRRSPVRKEEKKKKKERRKDEKKKKGGRKKKKKKKKKKNPSSSLIDVVLSVAVADLRPLGPAD